MSAKDRQQRQLKEDELDAVRELSDDELKAISGGTFGEPMGKTDVIKVMGNNPRPNDTAMGVWSTLLRQYGF